MSELVVKEKEMLVFFMLIGSTMSIIYFYFIKLVLRMLSCT